MELNDHFHVAVVGVVCVVGVVVVVQTHQLTALPLPPRHSQSTPLTPSRRHWAYGR